MKKKLYENPESELIVLTFDQVIMGPSDPITPGSAGGDDEYNDMGDF